MASGNKKKKAVAAGTPEPQQIQQAYIRAQQLQQSGFLTEAENLYRQILEVMPDQPDAMHYLGLVLLNKGQTGEAERLVKQSIKIQQNPFYLSNYGMLLGKLGRHAESVAHYQQAVAIKPDYAEAWFNLGVVYETLSRPDESESAYRKAISINKNYIKAMLNLASLLVDCGRPDETDTIVDQLQQVIPDNWQGYAQLARALQRIGGKRNIDQAFQHLQKAIEQNPDSLELHGVHAELLLNANQLDEAAEEYRYIFSKEPDNLEYKIAYADCLRRQQNVEKAEKHYRDVYTMHPGNRHAKLGLGDICIASGEFDKAETYFRDVMAIQPDNVGALHGLVRIRKVTPSDKELLESLERLSRTSNNVILWFALGKAYNDLGEYDKAFKACQKGNEQKKRRINYDPVENRNYVDSIIKTFTPGLLDKLQESGLQTDLPIFIFGPPRSGTTLTEQILSAIPGVKGAGELLFIQQIANEGRTKRNTEKYPGRLLTISPADIHEDACFYIEKVRAIADDSEIKRITDKFPLNFLFAGYIAGLFPKAKLIYCQRHPLDTCLSNYFQLFESGNQHSFDLENLADWYIDHMRLMQHWRELLGEQLFTVNYEQLVSDPETETRKLVSYCGLDWDDKCLEFYKSNRSVMTASYWQVRQPIYSDSVERWKRYDKHIGILKEKLWDYI